MESEGLIISDDLRDAHRQVAMLHLQIARMDDERKEQLSSLEAHMQSKQSRVERSHQEQINLLQEDLQVVRNERNRMMSDLRAKLASIEKRYAEKDGELRKARLEIFQLRVERDEARRYAKGVEREGSSTQHRIKPGEVSGDLRTDDCPDGMNTIHTFIIAVSHKLIGPNLYLVEENIHSNPLLPARPNTTLVSFDTLLVTQTRNPIIWIDLPTS